MTVGNGTPVRSPRAGQFEVLIEDDEERQAIVLVDAADEDAARRRVRYMLDWTAARIVTVRMREAGG